MIDSLLDRHHLRSTPARRAVLGLLTSSQTAVTHAELEAAADADRITLYRTIKTFEECGILHCVRTLDGQAKYALCGDNCGPAAHAHTHPHFECRDCGHTFCLPDSVAPKSVLPKGYLVQETLVTFQGQCPTCVQTA